MLSAGAPRESLISKIFGGASSAPAVDAPAQRTSSARESLARARIPVVAADVGGRRGRHVTFDVGTGAARIHYLAGP